MEVLYVDMENLEIGNLEKFMADKLELGRKLGKKIIMKVVTNILLTMSSLGSFKNKSTSGCHMLHVS